MTRYQVRVGTDVRLEFAANFSEAACPIVIVRDGAQISTPYQVADARHRPAAAATLLNAWLRQEGGEAWGADEAWVLSEEY